MTATSPSPVASDDGRGSEPDTTTEPDPTARPTVDGDASTPPPRRRRSRRGLAIGAGVVVIVVVAAVLVGRSRSTTPAASTAGAVPTGTAKVEQRSLVKTDAVDATLDYAAVRPVVNQRAGTLTAVPTAGSTVERGKPLFHIDAKPVILMYGDTPVYRQLDQTSSPGPDVRQLEDNLVQLGFGDGVTVDDTFDAGTAYAVERWENSVGLDGDGIVQLGEVVFEPGAVRAGDPKVTIGSSVAAGNEAIGVTSTDKVVTADLDATHAGEVKQGDTVTVTLPNGRTANGTVASLGPKPTAATTNKAPSAGGGNSTSVAAEAIITFPDGAALNGIDTGPVKVQLVNARRDNVKVVPVTALVALAEGGYAVQLADTGAGGRARLVAVTPGLIANGSAEITGNVDVGAQVVVPK